LNKLVASEAIFSKQRQYDDNHGQDEKVEASTQHDTESQQSGPSNVTENKGNDKDISQS
jgi:hypothetical protein